MTKTQEEIERVHKLKGHESKWVVYRDPHTNTQQIGRLKSINDMWAFVVFDCDNHWDNYKDYTARGCLPERIEVIQQEGEKP